MLAVTHRGDWVTFAVKVVPRAGRDELAGVQDGVLRVRLTAPPVAGAANRALVEFLADRLGVPRRDIEIVAGHTGHRKVVRVSGLAPEQVIVRLQAPGRPGDGTAGRI